MYIKVINDTFISHMTINKIKKEFNSSFPANYDYSKLEGIEVLNIVEQPSGNVVQCGVPQKIGDKWYQTWEVRDFTEQELANKVKEAKEEKIKRINQLFESKAIENVTINNSIYKGGDVSASAINGAITLAKVEGVPTVDIWDADKVTRTYTISEAEQIAYVIGKTYAGFMYRRNELISAVNACTTVSEINAIEIE